MASAEQQAIMSLQADLATTRDQVMAITQRFDTLQGAHTQLASGSNRLFINLSLIHI